MTEYFERTKRLAETIFDGSRAYIGECTLVYFMDWNGIQYRFNPFISIGDAMRLADELVKTHEVEFYLFYKADTETNKAYRKNSGWVAEVRPLGNAPVFRENSNFACEAICYAIEAYLDNLVGVL